MKATLRILGFHFSFLFTLVNCSAQWIQTEVTDDFFVYDLEVYNEELYAVFGHKVIKFQENELSFDVLTNNHEFQYSLASNSDYIFAGNNRFDFSTQYGVLRSTEGDTTWARFENQLPNATIFSLSAKDNLIAAGGAFGVYASWDNGMNWTRTLQYPGFGYFFTPILLGKNVTLVGGQDLVNISYDTMRTWTNAKLDGQVRTLLKKDNILYVGTHNNAYRSIDNGTSWEAINNGLREDIFISEMIDYKEDSIMVISGGELFTLKNGDKNWNLYDSPDFTKEFPVGSYHLIIYNNQIWIGGPKGIWRKRVDNLVSSEDIIGNSSKISLYPNPFSNYFSVEQTSFYLEGSTLFLYNTEGRQVQSVQLKDATQQIVTSNLMDGLYFYQIKNEAGQLINSGKIVKKK